MPLKTQLIWVGWEDGNIKELMVFHGVILNVTRCVKCSVKDVFSEQWRDSSEFYRDIFSREFYSYIGIFVSPPLLGLELQIMNTIAN
jgi:hypothetical protein